MSEPISYQCAIITGASAGLGEEFARQLAPHCRQLVLLARREERLIALADSLQSQHPHLKVIYELVDLTDPVSRQICIENLAHLDLRPDLLINNAGMGDYGEFPTADWGKLEAMIALNITALTHLSHALIPGMQSRGGGAILNVSSLASILPIPDFAVYAATKAYVSSLSEALRLELKESNISVTALCPGPVHTEFGEVAMRGDTASEIPGKAFIYVSKEKVVRQALAGIARNQARVYPGYKIALFSAAISMMPLVLLRIVLSKRPVRVK